MTTPASRALPTDPTDLSGTGLSAAWVAELVERTLTEDLTGGAPLPSAPDVAVGYDVTSAATVPGAQFGTADLVARADGVVAGLPLAARVFTRLAPGATLTAGAADGDRVRRGDVLLTVRGPVRALLAAERSALNIASRASGIATATRAWVDAVAGTGAVVLDTRKTTPGLRPLEKYAVRCGGGANKRMGLYDVAMIKDNHVAAAGSVAAAVALVRERAPRVTVQVECDTLDQVGEALDAGADFLLLDNMTPDQLRQAVALVGDLDVDLEATGGLTLDVAREVADTGIDFLSVGALTHSSPILDLALDLRAG
ncbi:MULTISPECIES: carboxylating nicotinate-nucleotide diphosphorylase [unclassified Modestobacter]|uniref:carboxylating nicotinate-nucleotide diphosphorylase n=1 Tax=unclassified Modestobacter TaxID=2643866 RepID=UPI0022AA6130|nr:MULTISPECIES: carboxylating nicotinate-nucleotide diphosphorylase [unclassified Modestobacter]MCZ2825332.1 carboxylating nicotinate-nucleotide diphosphorylase [Modestobacter sp. VKM Ac-2981]MCZ2853603.1 carboxylating nicotinate-nucleotide diphosphorylase [Modestobacter sp. VKM Ac-2982]